MDLFGTVNVKVLKETTNIKTITAIIYTFSAQRRTRRFRMRLKLNLMWYIHNNDENCRRLKILVVWI